jgi:predicted MFS family arabinose efflux permease
MTFSPHHNVARLAVAQALAGANSVVVYATGAIIGHLLAPSPALATLPISIFVVGMALATLPVGVVTRKHGRRAAFLVGSICGVLVGLGAAAGLLLHSFEVFCVSMLFGGAYAAVVLTFRFAAADCVPPEDRPKALSIVLGGGVAAGIVGPRLVTATMDLWPGHAYVATYLVAAVVALLAGIILLGVRIEPRPQDTKAAVERSLPAILRQGHLLVAMFCGVASYMTMNFMMTSAPLAMEICGISRVHANQGIELHVVAMYAPSFFTGRLITRFGAPSVIIAGFATIAAASVAGMSGLTVDHFWVALILLGIGWNFGFLGASSLVLSCHGPGEGPRVQSINDFTVFGSMVIGSFLSGGLLSAYGWTVVSSLLLLPVFLAAASLLWLKRFQSRAIRRVN